MEAVASASAIMAVVEIAFSVSKALATYATAVKGAPKRSRDLREEARLLSEALKTVRQKTTSWHHSEVSAVKGMMHAIDEVTSILKELESRMHVSKGDIFGRLAWPFTESETNKYLEKFQRYNTSFQLILRSLDRFGPPLERNVKAKFCFRTTLESIEYTGQVTDRKVTDMYTIALGNFPVQLLLTRPDTSGKAREGVFSDS